MNSFVRLLQEILSPAEKDTLELDSVFQLKNLVKSYYQKKGLMCDGLSSTLYAMLCERPNIIDVKKKHFMGGEDSDLSQKQTELTRNMFFDLEQMRLKAEHERITNYKEMIEGLISEYTSKAKSYNR